MSTIRVIEFERARGSYDLPRIQAIVHTEEFGRLFITQTYSGENDLRGGMYRWDDSICIGILDTDTLETLNDPQLNWMPLIDCSLNGYDEKRLIIPLKKDFLKRLVKELELFY